MPPVLLTLTVLMGLSHMGMTAPRRPSSSAATPGVIPPLPLSALSFTPERLRGQKPHSECCHQTGQCRSLCLRSARSHNQRFLLLHSLSVSVIFVSASLCRYWLGIHPFSLSLEIYVLKIENICVMNRILTHFRTMKEIDILYNMY